MNYHQIKGLLIFFAAMGFAIWMGYAVAMEDYFLMAVVACTAIAVILLLMPGYIPLLAFGLLDPLAVPIPFIIGFPPLIPVLGICLLKYVLRRGLIKKSGTREISAMVLPFGIFFAWVFFRYCLNPVLPNVAGFGENVTGFRPYMNYAICFVLVFTVGRFIQSRADLVKLIRWLAGVSAFFLLLFVGLMFTRNFAVASVLNYLGVFVSVYDNGVFRFVVLPSFGLILISLALLPDLLVLRKSLRICLLLLGGAAVLLGGNRSGLAMAGAIIMVTPLLKKDFRRFSIIAIGTVLFFVGAYFLGETLGRSQQTGILRALALVSPQMAASTQASDTWEFREIRWRRALEEIRNHPWVGRGYGGVENAFIWNDWNSFEQARVEIDLASGGVHNGYIACALALGIPAALMFIGIFGWSIWHNAKLAMRIKAEDRQASSIHIFVCASLVGYMLSIYIGTDLNNPMIWFFLGLGVLMKRIRLAERVRSKVKASPPAAAVNAVGVV